MSGHTLERSHIGVTSVARRLFKLLIWRAMSGYTRERSHISVTSVARLLVTGITWWDMSGHTLETCRSHVLRGQRTFDNEKAYQCDRCGKAFSLRYTLVKRGGHVLERNHSSVASVAKHVQWTLYASLAAMFLNCVRHFDCVINRGCYKDAVSRFHVQSDSEYSEYRLFEIDFSSWVAKNVSRGLGKARGSFLAHGCSGSLFFLSSRLASQAYLPLRAS